MSFYFRVALLCIFSWFAAAASAQSVTDGVLVNAKEYDADLASGITRLKGGVQLVFQGQHLSCNRAEINQKTQTITAIGNVILSNERVHVEGDKIVFNYKQNTGFIYNGFVRSGQVVFEGDVIEKVGETRYLASNAEYTACDTCPPGWAFSGRAIDAEIGGYARIKRPVFKIGGVPVLILPSLIVPLKSARQSGFLVPSMDYSQLGGLALAESYFWAIDRSRDLTLTARWYEFRGYKLQADYRYVLSENSKGELMSGWMLDRSVATPEFQRDKPLNRWYVDYSHYYEMPEGFVHRADITRAADLRYTRDFPMELKGHGDPALETKTSISKSSDDHYASAEVDLYTNLLKTFPLADNDDAVHRFPEIRYSLKDKQLFENGPYVAFDVDYVNFARDKYNYDDLRVNGNLHTGIYNDGGIYSESGVGPRGEIARDGNFDVLNDLNRTGQRLDVRPTISYPFQIAKKFDVIPTVSYRETQYRFYTQSPDFGATAARRYVQGDLKIKTEFSRVYGDLNNAQSNRIKHSIEPEIGYSHIPWMRRPSHPFFGGFQTLKYSRQYDPVSDADILNPPTGVQFDYEDRTYERQAVDLALTQRLTRKTWLNGEPDYYTSVLFRIAQSYDLNEARQQETATRGKPHPWSPISALLNVRLNRFETYTTAVYNPYANVTNTNSRLRLMSKSRRDFVEFGYNENFIINDRDEIVVGRETRSYSLGAGIARGWAEFVGDIYYNDRTFKIQSWGYALNLRPPGNCWVITVNHRQILGGYPEIRGSLSFDFGGEVMR